MIGKLTGTLEIIYQDNSILLDVYGVSYIVHCSIQTIFKLPKIGQKTSLLIEMQMTENNITLYGFLEEQEKLCFKHLRSVQGIGGKVTMIILGTMPVQEIITSIYNGDTASFQKISGIGRKIATRIVTELKNNKNLQSLLGNADFDVSSVQKNTGNTDIIQDAISAITKLGFSHNIVTSAVNRIYQENPHITLENLLKRTITNLGK